MEATSLTIDILPTILSFITSCGDLLRLSLVSRTFYYYTSARLYDGSLFRCTNPLFGSWPSDYRQYVRLLRTLGDHLHLAAMVRIFVVPHMKFPHERYDDLWERAMTNCVHLEEFRWHSTLSVPLSVIRSLSSKSRLRKLSLPPGRLLPHFYLEALFRIRPLEELVLHSPPKYFSPRCTEWIMGMSDSLRLLDLKTAEWIDDSIFHSVVLTNLEVLRLHGCRQLTAAGILPLLRNTPRLEVLCLGLSGVRVADLVRPGDNEGALRLPFLRNISISWDHSLAFWIHVQELLVSSPIEAFHIIRSKTERHITVDHSSGPIAQSHAPLTTLPYPFASGNAWTLSNPIPLSLSVTDRHMTSVDEGFVSRFVDLHHTTLRKFWVVGLRCSDRAVHDLCYGCEKLERLKGDDVDEFPLIERPGIERRFSKSFWSWWWLRNS